MRAAGGCRRRRGPPVGYRERQAGRQFSAKRERNPLIESQQAHARAQSGLKPPSFWPRANARSERVAIHPSGKLIALADGSGVALWDMGTGRLVASLGRGQAGRGGAMAAMLGALAAIADWPSNSLGSLFGSPGSQQVPGMAIDSDQFLDDLAPLITRSLAFSADGRMLTAGQRLWDGNTGAELSRRPIAAQGEIRPFPEDFAESSVDSAGAAFSPDGRMTARGVGPVIRISDVASGNQQVELVGHSSNVKTLPIRRTAPLAERRGRRRAQALGSRDRQGDRLADRPRAEDFATVTPDQYYRISKSSAKGVGFRVRDRIYPFEQFDLRFNRPDIVLQRLGAASPETVQSYRQPTTGGSRNRG